MATPYAYARSQSWSSLSPTADFYYRLSGEIISGSFRIVTLLPGRPDDPIQCRLHEVSLKDCPTRFIALSYCWNTSKAPETIWCDGRSLQITANLFAALRNARAASAEVNLWIDQICVDQTNIIDRNDQVSKMGAIFKAASGVIVWLGEESHGSSAAMELPKRIRRFWPSLYDDPNELTNPDKTPAECPRWGEGAWPAFIMLLTRPWFRRLWVIQEVVCARDIVVTCGTATSFWDDFVKLVHVVEARHHSALGVNHMLGSKTAAQYINFMQELRTITSQGTKQAVKDYASEESMAPYVLTMAKDCEATDHRDKLFAFHHLVRLWTKPDYNMEIEMLYELFAVQYLQRIAYAISEFSCDEVTLFRRQLEFIYTGGLCNQRLDLPSWCPDWSVPWQARPLWLGTSCYSAGASDVAEVTPLTDTEPGGRPRLRLPMKVKFFDRVVAAGSEGLQIFLRGRVFFLTEKGYYGLAQAGLDWGDSIAIVRGAPVPVLLRPTLETGPQSREYRLLCEGFVLGIMDGEVWNDDTIPREDIMLV
ncbi:hypothetical protein M409DRAFT_68812 [Zasmidium cellare ATCC 36951]|uniref:Heterokaryon incompatibility domain-containing protein n=1 Tax=Zasmidium cellare ATCC 36951 TaxID=1080233 RepID=A0A6A6C702_ZASCE|nr:uncharacterized protein M409DRAFT_68812 [Zasmidium cellare ATCC 36951]KAF2162815.1 hypothetical protein M409DRAFT_68812 [Zasmidium cellare ATCC 36951]